MATFRLIEASIALVGLAMLLGAAIYESVVMAPNYASAIPQSLEHIRAFLVATNPGLYFRVLSPLTQLSALVAVALNWRVPGARWWLVAALGVAVLTDVVTYKWHYPRNDLMFVQPLDGVPAVKLEAAAREWARGNYVRIAMLAAAVICALLGLSSMRIASVGV